MELKSVIILLSHLFLLCENSKFTIAIAYMGHGIRDAVEKEFSFLVSIGLPGKLAYVDEKHLCTGTLISRWHVLTAAHCLTGVEKKILQVTIGSVDLRKGRAFFSDKWITYDQWARKKRIAKQCKVDDVAVMKLTEEVNEETIVPAKVWRGTNQELYNKSAVVAGWGYTNDVEDTSRILQVANVIIPANKECSESIDFCSERQTNLVMHSRYLCSKSNPHVLMGPGDSGGPLIYKRHTVVGVAEGQFPPDINLNPNLYLLDINKLRINLYSGTTSYQNFIDDCLDHY